MTWQLMLAILHHWAPEQAWWSYEWEDHSGWCGFYLPRLIQVLLHLNVQIFSNRTYTELLIQNYTLMGQTSHLLTSWLQQALSPRDLATSSINTRSDTRSDKQNLLKSDKGQVWQSVLSSSDQSVRKVSHVLSEFTSSVFRIPSYHKYFDLLSVVCW